MKSILIHLDDEEYKLINEIKEKNKASWKEMLLVSIKPKNEVDLE